LNIYIDSWHAWQPRAGKLALSISARQGRLEEAELEKPALKTVPAMQRRRLGPLARVAFHVLGQCVDTSKQEPVVFSSLMGEIQRTQRILGSIASDEAVSPTAFSLSVHNAISGQWSMIHDIRAPMVALSPIQGNCVPALLEAAGILQEQTHPAVNVIFYEEDYPSFYAPFLEGAIAPAALALRLVTEDRAGSDTLRLSVNLAAHLKNCSKFHGPLDLVPLLKNDLDYLDIATTQSSWRLQRCS